MARAVQQKAPPRERRAVAHNKANKHAAFRQQRSVQKTGGERAQTRRRTVVMWKRNEHLTGFRASIRLYKKIKIKGICVLAPLSCWYLQKSFEPSVETVARRGSQSTDRAIARKPRVVIWDDDKLVGFVHV